MTASPTLIGFGAGVASALLCAALASGSPLGYLLAHLAPLPILIAGLGWRHVAGLIGAGVGALILFFAFGPTVGVTYAVSVGLPSWWLAYLTLLARPGDAQDETQWYPIGRLVVWCALIGAVLVCLSIPLISTDLESYRAFFRDTFGKAFETALTRGRGSNLPPGLEPKVLHDFVAVAMPFAMAMFVAMFLSLNLWLAARVCRASGRLVRPWPDLARFELPRGAALGLAASFLGSFLPGISSLVAELFMMAFLFVFSLLGLAVLHIATRGVAARGLVLYAVYALVLLTPASVFLAGIGLAEQLLGIRRRFGPPPGGPPAPANQP